MTVHPDIVGCAGVSAILFDNDGVLVDTEGFYFQANREALARFGLVLDREAYVELFLHDSRGAWDLLRARGVGEPAIRDGARQLATGGTRSCWPRATEAPSCCRASPPGSRRSRDGSAWRS